MRVWLLPIVMLAPMAAAQPSFEGLGHLDGPWPFSEALAVSGDGTFVFGDSVTGGIPLFGISEAFVEASELPIQALDPQYSGLSSTPYAASADGTVAGGTLVFVPINVDAEAFRWSRGGGTVSIGDLPGGLLDAATLAMNADGSVLVGAGSSDTSYQSCVNCYEAWRWTEATGMVALGDLPGGVYDSRARGISADGTVIVGQGTTDDGPVAVRWVDGQPQSLGYLPLGPNDPKQSECLAMSADGRVAVGASSSKNGIFEAFRWTERDGMEGLGDLPGDPFTSYAWACSADGSVIVGMGIVPGGLFGAGEGRAFIWDREHGMRSMVDVLTGLGLDVSGWVLQSARGVSADGLTVVGIGYNPEGWGEGWIARLGTPCYADFTGDGVLDLFDFLAYVNAFNEGDDRADCTGDGGLDLFDFLCFVNAFNGGC